MAYGPEAGETGDPALTEPDSAPSPRPSEPLPSAPPSEPLPPPPDAPYDLRFYVHRAEGERRAFAKLATPGAPVVIWGPWISGKSWMLAYLLERIQEEDASAGEQTTVIDVDLKSLLPEPATADGLL